MKIITETFAKEIVAYLSSKIFTSGLKTSINVDKSEVDDVENYDVVITVNDILLAGHIIAPVAALCNLYELLFYVRYKSNDSYQIIIHQKTK